MLYIFCIIDRHFENLMVLTEIKKKSLQEFYFFDSKNDYEII